MSIRTVSPEEAEKADIVICIPATWDTPFTDNVLDICSVCGIAVQLRPSAPKRPPRVCMPCGLLMMEAERETKQ